MKTIIVNGRTKQWNKAIDEAIQLVTCNEFKLATDMVFALESLKTT